MQHATSGDGTLIAFHQVGIGAPVVIVGGAFSTAEAGAPLAAALAAAGLRGVTVDRRARGNSGDTAPYLPAREAEDLAAVINAIGGEAAVIGHSSGAVLALFAAAEGVPMTHLFLSEPPFRFGEGEPSADLPERLQSLIDEGHPDEAVVLFQREAVGLPDPVIEQIRSSPMFAALVPLAQSTVYDALLTSAVSTPTAAMIGVEVPVTILRGEPTFPMLVAAADRLAELMPHAELVVVPESHDHGVDPAGTVREVYSRLARPGSRGPFIPPDFEPPSSLSTGQFLLEPLGPQHNQADHAAWTSSIEHIRATPGYQNRVWPPLDGMSLEANLADLRSHAEDFTAGRGFTFTVLDPADGNVIGCVYLYPPESEGDVSVRSWVRADRSDLDQPLAEAVANWIAAVWPWQHLERFGR